MLSDDFMEKLNSVTNKRARFVIDKILEQGFCSTQDLKDGGYEHAPRAARDVRELGIPLVTFKGMWNFVKHVTMPFLNIMSILQERNRKKWN